MTRATVLIVDEDPLVRWSLKERLAADGYDVFEAATSAAALEQLRDGVDVMLADARLGDDEDCAVLKNVRDLHSDTRVILFTPYSGLDVAADEIEPGRFQYVEKPFDLDQVGVLVEKTVEASRPQRAVSCPA